MNAEHSERLSTSKLELALQCLYWLLPSAGPPVVGKPDIAKAGTTEHKHIEHTMRTGDVTERSPTHERWIDTWYMPYGSEGHWIIEQGMAMDDAGVVILGPGATSFEDGTERYAWAPSDFVPGTADAIQLIVDGVVVTPERLEELRADAGEIVVRVIDWKSGFRARTHLARAKRNLQMLHLAAMAVQYYGADAAIVEIIIVRPDGTWRDHAKVDAMDLVAIRHMAGRIIRTLVEMTDAKALAPRRGPWCSEKYCPQHGVCPATKGALGRIHDDFRRVEVPRRGYDIRGPQHATELYHLARNAQASLNELWNSLRAWQDEIGPVMIRTGLAWGRRQTSMERIDLDVQGAMDVLQKHLGDHWWRAVNFKTAKVSSKPGSKSIYSAARLRADELSRENGKRVTIKSIDEAVIEELRLIGAAAPKIGTRVDEYPVSESDVQNYPWLLPDPDGAKVVERLEEEDPDDEEQRWE